MWRLLLEPSTPSAAYGVALDEVLLQQVKVPTLRLWINQRCLVLGRFDARLPNLDKAVDVFASENIPLLMRSSGGTTVWHDSGVFNVSVIAPKTDAPFGVHEAFEALAAGMVGGLNAFGLNAGFGRVPNSYCDGPHNLVISGKKIAGLAQTQKRSGVLVHASILNDVDIENMHNQIELFYAATGNEKTFLSDSVTSLRIETKKALSFDELSAAMVAGYERQGLEVELSYVSSEERNAARQLSAQIMLPTVLPRF